MRSLPIKSYLLLSIFLTAVSIPYAIARDGTGSTGGGDPNEPVFNDIATNISGWIQSGNSEELKLPEGIFHNDYKQKMLDVLAAYHISFTNDKIYVAGAEKTCENYRDDDFKMQIRCNNDRFEHAYNHEIDRLYRTVHHEIASLAGLEINHGEDSDYKISDQVSGFLAIEKVKRLPIVRTASEKHVTITGAVFMRDRSIEKLGEAYRDPENRIWGAIGADKQGNTKSVTQAQAIDYCNKIHMRLPKREEYEALAKYLGADSGGFGYSPYMDEGKKPVLPFEENEGRTWIEDKVPGNEGKAGYVFDMNSGTFYTSYLSADLDSAFVRCISVPGK